MQILSNPISALTRSADLLLKFWDPLYISEMVEARNFKFGMHIDHIGL